MRANSTTVDDVPQSTVSGTPAGWSRHAVYKVSVTRVRNLVSAQRLSEGSETLPGMGEQLGYAKVSTTDQDLALQHDALGKAGCYRVYSESVSGALANRAELAAVLEALRPGDTLVVWRLDRLGRSLRHLIDTVHELDARGASASARCRSQSTRPPPGAGWSSTSSPHWPSSSATDPRANCGRPAGRT